MSARKRKSGRPPEYEVEAAERVRDSGEVDAHDRIDCDEHESLGFSDDPLVPGGHFRAQRLVQLADEEPIDVVVRYANVDVRKLWCGECAEQGEYVSWLGESLSAKERTLSLQAGVKVFRVYHIDPTAPMIFESRRAD